MHIKETLLCCLVLCATLFTGCSKDDDIATLPEGQGEVTFKFVRNKVYDITTLEEMTRLKVTLEKDGKKIVLETVDLNGNEEELTSAAVAVEEGTYKVVKYVAYNDRGVQVQEAYVDDENTITIKHGEMATFSFPIAIRIVHTDAMLQNKLFGLCEEVLGSDSTRWPKTWRIENEDLLTWENLEFETDDDGNIMYLVAINFDEKTFPGMKKLPAMINSFSTLESIQIMDMPEFEELPDNMDETTFSTIMIMNTGFKAFPKNFEKMEKLATLSVINSKLTELPTTLADLPEIRVVEISGNEIKEFPSVLADKWQKLISLRMNHTLLTSLPSNLFSMKKASTFDFHDNPNLTSLPETRDNGSELRMLLLDGCGFTSIPQIAKGRMHTLSLADNKITSVSETELNGLSDELQTLILDGNHLSAFPKMKSESLIELSLANCGLTAIPDLSGLPDLHELSLSGNDITAVGNGVFTNNPHISILDFSNNSRLASFSEDAGIKLVDQQDMINGASTTIAKPYYLGAVNVDNCPTLTWEVPATWCCIKNYKIFSKEDLDFAPRNIVVYNRNSPGVTRAKCPVDGCKATYELPMSFDEFMESIQKK